jgi:hypothetical protein
MKKKFKYVAMSSSPEPPAKVEISPEVNKKREDRRKVLKEMLRQVHEPKLSQIQSEPEDAIDLTLQEDDESSSDPREGLFERFAANKAKGSQNFDRKTSGTSKHNADSSRSKGIKKKKTEEVGPSGQTYTPLELQVTFLVRS